jgi:hypothetical protein
VLPGKSWRTQIARRTNTLRPWLRICLLVLCGSFFGGIPAQASNLILPVSGSTVPIAINDFDGDLRPDVATVQAVSDNSSNTIYRIQLELSTGGTQSIHLAGPSGGLRIVARDVNDDGIPDLIVSLAWREKPLAVLVNDGRGVFSLHDPSSFPLAFGGAGKILNCVLPPQTDTVAIPPRLPVGDFSGSKYLLHPNPAATRSIPRPNSASFLSALLVSLPDRAPPTPTHA